MRIEVRKGFILQLVMHIEITPRKDLEEGFPVEVHFREIFVFLIIEIGIGESILEHEVPFGNDKPFGLGSGR